MVDLEAIEARANTPLDREVFVLGGPRAQGIFLERVREDCAALVAEVRRLRAALEAIAKHSPREVCKDDFAYDRLLEAVHEAAREALK